MFIDRRTSRFAAMLSATAGFVDAVGWLTSGGLFVSFMSGNVTKLGLGLAGHLENVLLRAGLIASFVAGVVVGSLVGRAAGGRQRRHVLCLVTGPRALWAAAAPCAVAGHRAAGAVGGSRRHGGAQPLCRALAGWSLSRLGPSAFAAFSHPRPYPPG